MKKYILKQNLPTFDEGDIFEFSDKGLIRLPRTKDEKPILAYIKSTVEKFGFLEKEKGFFEEIPEKPKSVWDLKGGDSLYFIGSQDIICKSIWYDCNLFLREREIGLIFLTKEEAEKELQKRKAIQKIKKYCWENNIDTKYNNEAENSYCFNLNNIGKVVFFDDFRNGNTLGYFSRKNAQKILDNFEEEIKIILN